jgi:hypothetical protein
MLHWELGTDISHTAVHIYSRKRKAERTHCYSRIKIAVSISTVDERENSDGNDQGCMGRFSIEEALRNMTIPDKIHWQRETIPSRILQETAGNSGNEWC